MRRSSQKCSRCQSLIIALTVSAMLWAGGCEEFLGKKATGRQVESIINELGQIKDVPEPNIPKPQIYTAPPEIVKQVVGGAEEWKLFYFCKHLTSDELKNIVHEQFATQLFNEKGISTTIRDYTISSLPATNQLIARCPLKEDVEAVLEVLEWADVPPIQVKIQCIVSEVYADKTLDWETTLEIENLLGEGIRLGGTAGQFGADVAELIKEGTILPAFPGASLRELAREKMGLKIGLWSEAHNLLALVDILESRGYLKIVMNPTLEVENGRTATVSSTQEVPIQQITDRQAQWGWVTSRWEYKPVIDSLQITPHVFAGNYIGLETDIVLGSKLTPEGVKQLPIVTKKEIKNDGTRIRQGDSLVIGGMRKTEKRDVLRGTPFLQDIPYIGILFSGRDFEERVVETVYILTPTISTGGIPQKEMIENIKRKHKTGESQQQDKTQEAEKYRLEAEAEKAEARHAVREAEAQIERAQTRAERAQEKAAAAEKQAQTEVEKTKAEAEAAKADANTAMEKAIATEKQAQSEVEKANAETELAKKEAEKATSEADKAKAEANTLKSELDTLKAQVEAIQQSIEKGTAEPVVKQQVSEETKAKAENTKTEAKTAEADKPTAETTQEKTAVPEKQLEVEKTKVEAEKEKVEVEKTKVEVKTAAETVTTPQKQAQPEVEEAKAQANTLRAQLDELKAQIKAIQQSIEKTKAEAVAKQQTVEETKVANNPQAEAQKQDSTKTENTNTAETGKETQTAKQDTNKTQSSGTDEPVATMEEIKAKS